MNSILNYDSEAIMYHQSHLFMEQLNKAHQDDMRQQAKRLRRAQEVKDHDDFPNPRRLRRR